MSKEILIPDEYVPNFELSSKEAKESIERHLEEKNKALDALFGPDETKIDE